MVQRHVQYLLQIPEKWQVIQQLQKQQLLTLGCKSRPQRSLLHYSSSSLTLFWNKSPLTCINLLKVIFLIPSVSISTSTRMYNFSPESCIWCCLTFQFLDKCRAICYLKVIVMLLFNVIVWFSVQISVTPTCNLKSKVINNIRNYHYFRTHRKIPLFWGCEIIFVLPLLMLDAQGRPDLSSWMVSSVRAVKRHWERKNGCWFPGMFWDSLGSVQPPTCKTEESAEGSSL